ncbi:transmembrane protein 116 [Larimichthys crocea]|uniref:transmembrane protein 116 n=1 Tax=Larimichthys crocea TaxID=215358 RepID=UPI000F600A88|nr:transmembrane protein 116 [Larimichthys crocea]
MLICSLPVMWTAQQSRQRFMLQPTWGRGLPTGHAHHSLTTPLPRAVPGDQIQIHSCSGFRLHHRLCDVTETQPDTRALLLLSVSDCCFSLLLADRAALFSQRCSSLNTHCYHLHTIEQMLYMASFFYTLNYVRRLYSGIRRTLCSCSHGHSVQFSNRLDSADRISAALSCLFPVLLMTPVFIQGHISQCQANFSEPYRCLLMHTGALYFTSEQYQPIRACRLLHTYCIAIFLATFSFTLLSIIVLMVKARRIHRRVVTSHGYLGNQQRVSLRVMDRRMLLYPLIFVVCWGPAVALAFLRLVKPSAGQGEAGGVLYISQAFTSASQGFLNCLVYGWTRERVRRAGLRALSRDVDTQTPLLRSQRSRSYQTVRTVG